MQAKTIEDLTQQVRSLTQQVDLLTVEVKSLKEKLSKNSNNSSKPLQVIDTQNQPQKAYVKSQENLLVVNLVTKAKR